MWQWSDGEPAHFFKWNLNTIYDFSFRDCVKLDSYGWSSDFCFFLYPFICYRSLILVNKNLTWEDALQYCRTHYSGLAVPSSVSNPGMIEQEAAETQTVSVWLGLRFLDGNWFWVGKDQLKSPDSLPSCPRQNYGCGARNTETHVWENRDCKEKLNFVCYWG